MNNNEDFVRFKTTYEICQERRRLETTRGRRRGMVYVAIIALIGSIAWNETQADTGNTYVDNPDAFIYLNPLGPKWTGGNVNYVYNTNGLISNSGLVSIINGAADEFERRFDLNFTNQGTSTVSANHLSSSPPVPGKLLVEFISDAEMQSRHGNYSGYAWIWWSGSIQGGQIELNADTFTSCLAGVTKHEIGHILNLDHNNGESVMNNSTSCAYKETLRFDDINGLNQMYPSDSPDYSIELISATAEEVCIYAPRLDVNGTDYEFEACIPASGFGTVVEN